MADEGFDRMAYGTLREFSDITVAHVELAVVLTRMADALYIDFSNLNRTVPRLPFGLDCNGAPQLLHIDTNRKVRVATHMNPDNIASRIITVSGATSVTTTFTDPVLIYMAHAKSEGAAGRTYQHIRDTGSDQALILSDNGSKSRGMYPFVYLKDADDLGVQAAPILMPADWELYQYHVNNVANAYIVMKVK